MIIRAKNFLSWENLVFQVVNGVTLITGFNHDDGTPEGSGKSAILNALCWGLFGAMPKDANVDEVIREGAKGCEVTIELPEFSVFRARKPNDLHMVIGEKIHRGKDARETQKDIEKALGMTFETFCQSIYFAQNYQNKFVTANQEAKGKILSEIQDLEQFDRARDAAAKRAKAAKELLAAAIKDVERYEALHGESLKSINSYEQLIANFHQEKVSKIQNFIAQIQTVEEEAEAFVEKFENDKASKLKRLKDEEKGIKAQLKANQSAHSELKAALAQFDSAALEASYNKLEEQETDIDSKRNDVRVKMGSIEALMKAQEKREKDLKKLQADLAKVVVQHVEFLNKTKACEEHVESSKKELMKVEAALKNPEKGDCPTCGQAWDGDKSHYEKEVTKAERNYKIAKDALTDNLNGIKEYGDRAEELNESIEVLQKEVDEFEAPKTSKLEKEIEKLTTDLEQVRAEMKRIEKEYNDFEKEELRVKSFEKEVQNSQKLLDLKVAERTRLEEDTPISQLEGFQKRIDQLTAQVESEDKKEPTLLEEKLESSKLSAEKHSKNLLKADAEREEHERKLLRLEALRDGYREVKAYTFQSVLNQLTRKANSYLAELFEQPVKIQFQNVDMKIDVVVTIGGKPRSLGLYSGGQARRIHLAVDLALSDIVMSRKGNKLPLMILDEYCKDLSEVSMEKVLKLLQSRKGSTILIEHNSIFKSIVTNTFDVELIDGISRKVA